MRIAGASIVFSRKPLEGALDGLKDLGFEYVDLGTLEGWAHLNPSEVARDVGAASDHVAKAAGARGLGVIALNASLGEVQPAIEEARLDALARLASSVGAGVVTLNSAKKETPFAQEIDRFRRLVPLAEGRGVQLTVETHFFCHTENPAAAVRLCNAAPGLGLTLDPSHFAVGPYWEQGFDELLPFVRHLHAREAGREWKDVQMPAGEGVIDYGELVAKLRAAGYAGDVTVEYVDSLPGVDHAREAGAMRALLAGQTA